MVVATSANSIALPQLISHSLYYYIRDKLDNDGLDSSYVKIINAYPISGAIVDAPLIVIDDGTISDEAFELGGVDLATIYYTFDVYGKSQTQRNTLTWLLRTYLNDKRIDVKDYNEGFPPGITDQTVLGVLQIIDIRIVPTVIVTEGEIPENLRLLKQLELSCQYILD